MAKSKDQKQAEMDAMIARQLAGTRSDAFSTFLKERSGAVTATPVLAESVAVLESPAQEAVQAERLVESVAIPAAVQVTPIPVAMAPQPGVEPIAEPVSQPEVLTVTEQQSSVESIGSLVVESVAAPSDPVLPEPVANDESNQVESSGELTQPGESPVKPPVSIEPSVVAKKPKQAASVASPRQSLKSEEVTRPPKALALNGDKVDGYKAEYLVKRGTDSTQRSHVYISTQNYKILDVLRKFTAQTGSEVGITQLLNNIVDDHIAANQDAIRYFREQYRKEEIQRLSENDF